MRRSCLKIPELPITATALLMPTHSYKAFMKNGCILWRNRLLLETLRRKSILQTANGIPSSNFCKNPLKLIILRKTTANYFSPRA